MKNFRSINSNLLTLDACDYLFVEWLVRHDLYSAFVKNLASSFDRLGAGRSLVRRYVRSFLSPRFYLESAIVMAFPFDETPEGFDFWNRVSDEWSKFCCDFFRK